MAALAAVTPASQRQTPSPAKPLPRPLDRFLGKALEHLVRTVKAVFPQGCLPKSAAMNVLDTPAPTASSSPSSSENKNNTTIDQMADTATTTATSPSASSTPSATSSTMHVSRRPRVMLHGVPGSGQAHLSAALLHALEDFPLYSLYLPALLGDVTARSPEEACVNIITECRRNAPSVLFWPSADLWWVAAPPSLRTVISMLLADLPSSPPVLVLATADSPMAKLPAGLAALFTGHAGSDSLYLSYSLAHAIKQGASVLGLLSSLMEMLHQPITYTKPAPPPPPQVKTAARDAIVTTAPAASSSSALLTAGSVEKTTGSMDDVDADDDDDVVAVASSATSSSSSPASNKKPPAPAPAPRPPSSLSSSSSSSVKTLSTLKTARSDQLSQQSGPGSGPLTTSQAGAEALAFTSFVSRHSSSSSLSSGSAGQAKKPAVDKDSDSDSDSDSSTSTSSTSSSSEDEFALSRYTKKPFSSSSSSSKQASAASAEEAEKRALAASVRQMNESSTLATAAAPGSTGQSSSTTPALSSSGVFTAEAAEAAEKQRQQQQQDEILLLHLRLFLRTVLAHLARHFKEFQQEQTTHSTVKRAPCPIFLSDMQVKVNGAQYLSVREFLLDIDLLVANTKMSYSLYSALGRSMVNRACALQVCTDALQCPLCIITESFIAVHFLILLRYVPTFVSLSPPYFCTISQPFLGHRALALSGHGQVRGCGLRDHRTQTQRPARGVPALALSHFRTLPCRDPPVFKSTDPDTPSPFLFLIVLLC